MPCLQIWCLQIRSDNSVDRYARLHGRADARVMFLHAVIIAVAVVVTVAVVVVVVMVPEPATNEVRVGPMQMAWCASCLRFMVTPLA